MNIDRKTDIIGYVCLSNIKRTTHTHTHTHIYNNKRYGYNTSEFSNDNAHSVATKLANIHILVRENTPCTSNSSTIGCKKGSNGYLQTMLFSRFCQIDTAIVSTHTIMDD